jgi:hypothetical protein
MPSTRRALSCGAAGPAAAINVDGHADAALVEFAPYDDHDVVGAERGGAARALPGRRLRQRRAGRERGCSPSWRLACERPPACRARSSLRLLTLALRRGLGLVAEDEETIRATHAHYCKTFDELLDLAGV